MPLDTREKVQGWVHKSYWELALRPSSLVVSVKVEVPPTDERQGGIQKITSNDLEKKGRGGCIKVSLSLL